MTSPDDIERTAEHLESVLADGKLPEHAIPIAERLLKRFNDPLRITVFGRLGAGKSGVVHLLSGANLGVEALRGASVRLTHAKAPSALITLRDGTTIEEDGPPDLQSIAAHDPALVDLRLPLVALKRVSVLELRISDDHADAVRAMNWALPRTDIAIWCTEYFTGDEQGLWNAVPEVIKDHALLIRTKADTLREDWDIAEDRLRSVARRNFAHVHALSTKQALAARLPDGSTDRGVMRNSGGTAVISTIRRQLDGARRTAADQMGILLEQNELAAPPPPPEEEPKSETSLEEKVKRAKQAIRQKTVPPPPVPQAPAEEAAIEGELRRALSDAASHLRDAGTALSRTKDPQPSRVLTRSLEALEELSERLMPIGPKAHPAVARTIDAAARAADMLEQMKTNPDEADTLKAITVLLQVKRGVEADLAA